MKSKTFEQAKKFYKDNRDRLVDLIHEEYSADIDHQIDENWDQVAVWFSSSHHGHFSLCYQDSDMNGRGKGEPHWDNDGANSGLDELKCMLSKDERFDGLIAEDEYWSNEYLYALVHDFCDDFAKKHDIANYFLCNQE